MASHLVIATRGSQLALWQANHVKDSLLEIDPSLRISLDVIRTRGDVIRDVPLAKVGGKGLFVKEIEEALLSERADLAVHSMKDVPMELPEGLLLGCMPKREDAGDCLLSDNWSDLEQLPHGAKVGTSSLRRQAQLLNLRPDLQILPLRGNIDTRLAKLNQGEYDAITLATAGLFRLGLHARHMAPLDMNLFIPAVGQGALGIECREKDYDLLVLLASLEDRHTRVCVSAERAFMERLQGGCQIPAAAHASMVDDDNVRLEAMVAEPDGSVILRSVKEGDASLAEEIGQSAADELLANGARKILDKLNN